MKIVYLTATGQTKKFVNKLNKDALEITPSNPFLLAKEPFIIIIPSYEPEITDIAWDFMDTGVNISHCKGVIGGGNRNFANLFCYSAKDFAVDYDVPYLHEFEFQGSPKDVTRVKELIEEIESGTHKYLTPLEQGYTGKSKHSYNKEEIRVVRKEINLKETEKID